MGNKPLLVGLHLGFAILGIDGLLWAAGEILANPENRKRLRVAVWLGIIGFVLSWLIGGYYYVKYYGSLVKPIIKAGSASWAHAVIMESKEHIFLFLIPLVCVLLCATAFSKEEFDNLKLNRPVLILVILAVAIALSLGAMGYIISAAARWG